MTKATPDRLAPPPAAPVEPAIRSFDPATDDARPWDDFVASHPDGTICHTAGWMRAVQRAFGHPTLAAFVTAGHRIIGVLPLMLVRSVVAGRLMVSVPYGTYGGVLATDDTAARMLLAYARRRLRATRAVLVEFRSGRAADPALPTLPGYLTFRRRLPDLPDDVPEWLPRKARAAVRRAAERHVLTTSFGDEHLETVWSLYSRSMRRLASPNYPLRFFRALVEATPGRHVVQLVHAAGRPAAGLLTFVFRDIAMPYFAGADDRLGLYGLHNFLYAESMKHAVRHGCTTYDFGRSRRDNAGACDFKRLHGFEPRPLAYQRFVPAGGDEPDLSPASPRWRAARAVWRRLPLSLTRWLGGHVARSIPG